ncbi:hypothetical protein E3N88_37052 [Mikania micrantha]|uniref:Uncharacterized protein n=1 Tax=Mikania micrantha TaxID=192012 RepID=A0A5N6M5Z4_9ASTR|nr:hypothetical protein E3N88_37052 [Mikania micrantha]
MSDKDGEGEQGNRDVMIKERKGQVRNIIDNCLGPPKKQELRKRGAGYQAEKAGQPLPYVPIASAARAPAPSGSFLGFISLKVLATCYFGC